MFILPIIFNILVCLNHWTKEQDQSKIETHAHFSNTVLQRFPHKTPSDFDIISIINDKEH